MSQCVCIRCSLAGQRCMNLFLHVGVAYVDSLSWSSVGAHRSQAGKRLVPRLVIWSLQWSYTTCCKNSKFLL